MRELISTQCNIDGRAPADTCGLGIQEISVYGAESTTEGGRVEGKAARYPEDVRDCPVLEVEDGTTKKPAPSSVMDSADYRLRQPDSDAIETTFELNDTLYAKAEIPPTDEVYLWLGVGRGNSFVRSICAVEG